MFLSILIPTYNYNCTQLVAELVHQAQAVEGLQYEIIVGDDGSTQQSIIETNRAINGMPNARYWETGCNRGRAVIRNRLYECSVGDWLLFLDCDGMPAAADFLSCYVSCIYATTAGCICGGVAHPAILPSPDVSLRWLHETNYAKRATLEWHNAHPYTNFRTFNFLIKRKFFSKVMFDESVCCYGYEDNLFGQALQEYGVEVLHIHNPMLNVDIEPNAVYLAKNEEALRTVAMHYDTMGRIVLLSKVLQKIERMHLGSLLSFFYRVLRPLMMRNLTGPSPRMWVFNFYRAGFLRELLRRGKMPML